MPEDSKNKNVHQGHRHRMRMRYMSDRELESFQDHEILEMLLYYVYARADTNQKAHLLLEQYGSLKNLFNASPADLMNRGALPEAGAVLLSMLPAVMSKCLSEEYTHGTDMSHLKTVVSFFRAKLVGRQYEHFYVVFLDGKKRFIKCLLLSEGTYGEVSFYPSKIIEQALIYKAVFAIIGHNHPLGSCSPSDADVLATNVVRDGLKDICVRLLDSIIICGAEEYYSFAENRLL